MCEKYEDSNKLAIVHQSMKDKGIEVQVKKDLEDLTQPLDKREWKQIGTYTGNGGEKFVPCQGAASAVKIQRLNQDPLEWNITDVNIVNDGTGIDLTQSELEKAIKDGTVKYSNGELQYPPKHGVPVYIKIDPAKEGADKSVLTARVSEESRKEAEKFFNALTERKKGNQSVLNLPISTVSAEMARKLADTTSLEIEDGLIFKELNRDFISQTEAGKRAFIYDCEGKGLSPDGPTEYKELFKFQDDFLKPDKVLTPERFRELYLGDFTVNEDIDRSNFKIEDLCKSLVQARHPFKTLAVSPANYHKVKEELFGFKIIPDPNVPRGTIFLINEDDMFKNPDYSLHELPKSPNFEVIDEFDYYNSQKRARGPGKSYWAGLCGVSMALQGAEEIREKSVVFDSMTKIRKGEHIGWTRNLVKRDKKKEKAKKQSRKRNRK